MVAAKGFANLRPSLLSGEGLARASGPGWGPSEAIASGREITKKLVGHHTSAAQSTIELPPSTTKVWPVVQAAPAEAR